MDNKDITTVVIDFISDPARAIPAVMSIAIQLGITHKLKFFLDPELSQFKKNRYIEAGSIAAGTLSYALMRLFWENGAGNEFTLSHFGLAVFIGFGLTLATPYLYKLLPANLKSKLSSESKIVRTAEGSYEKRDKGQKSNKGEETVFME